MNILVMNTTLTVEPTPIVVDYLGARMAFYVVLCITSLMIASAILFGGCSKRNRVYLMFSTLFLCMYTKCCGCRRESSEKIQTRGKELQQLIDEINNDDNE